MFQLSFLRCDLMACLWHVAAIFYIFQGAVVSVAVANALSLQFVTHHMSLIFVFFSPLPGHVLRSLRTGLPSMASPTRIQPLEGPRRWGRGL